MDGRQVSAAAAARKYYFAVNKPKGYVCAGAASEGRGDADSRLVIDLFEGWLAEWKARQARGAIPPRLLTVGRLDASAIGLLLVTNDGDWAQK